MQDHCPVPRTADWRSSSPRCDSDLYSAAEVAHPASVAKPLPGSHNCSQIIGSLFNGTAVWRPQASTWSTGIKRLHFSCATDNDNTLLRHLLCDAVENFTALQGHVALLQWRASCYFHAHSAACRRSYRPTDRTMGFAKSIGVSATDKPVSLVLHLSDEMTSVRVAATNATAVHGETVLNYSCSCAHQRELEDFSPHMSELALSIDLSQYFVDHADTLAG